jgi:hypothetical protein
VKHRHHIIPKHAGGSDDPSNIVELSVAEHAEAHRLLYEQYGRWQDRVAWQGLAGIIDKEEIVRIACSAFKGRKHSPEFIAKMKAPKRPEHAAKVGLTKHGKARKESTRKKISETRKALGIKLSPDHIEKLRAKAKLPKSPETRAKMAEARRQFWVLKRLANSSEFEPEP